MKNKGNIFWTIAMVIFACIFLVSAVKLIGILMNYHHADETAKQFDIYRPEFDFPELNAPDLPQTTEEPKLPKENPSIIKMKEAYPDVCGWVSIRNTNVDYPIARAEDNAYYLNRSLDGEETTYGTPFMDYRCSSEFDGVNTIVYGHNTKTKKMFSHLTRFKDKDYFDSHTEAVLFLPYDTYKLEIVACLLIHSDDRVIYDPYVEQDKFLGYIKSHAANYRETAFEEGDRFLTLSTCSYEFENARTVLIAKITK